MNLDKRNLWRRISQSEIRNSAAESEGAAEGGFKGGIPPRPRFPPPPNFVPVKLARRTVLF